jgi:hypothetical protein
MIRILLFLLAALTAAAPAYACKCRVIPYDEALAGTELAVIGKARTIVASERGGVRQVSARIRIHKLLKGSHVGRWVTVWTQGSSAACGYTFQAGQRVAFGLTRSPDGRWTTNSCVMYSLNQGR